MKSGLFASWAVPNAMAWLLGTANTTAQSMSRQKLPVQPRNVIGRQGHHR